MQNTPSFSEEIQGVREELRAQALQLNYARQYQEILEDLRQLKASVEQKWLYFRITVTLGSFIFAAAGVMLGWIGFHSLEDAKTRLAAKIDHNVKETSEFYGDVMAGSALFARGEYHDAIAKLISCFNNGHAYDKSILTPLLASLNITNDWDEADLVIQQLRSNSQKFDAINDASVYAIIGAIEIQRGTARYGFSSDRDAQREMDSGYKLLQRAYYLVGPNQNDLRQHILTNEWIYHIANREFVQAQQTVASLKSLPQEIGVYPWEGIRKWRCMVALSQREPSDTMRKAEEQWRDLSPRYFAKG